MKAIKVTDIIGLNMEKEDAILLRSMIERYIGEEVELDFAGIHRVPTTFLCCLLTDLINKHGRNYIASHVHVNNLTNTTDYNRVLLGTAFMDTSMFCASIN